MEGIHHRTLGVNGIQMHVAEKGSGPPVLLVHGFPELWYSWRHQITYLADHGFHAIAPDLRGYGDTEVPTAKSDYSIHHIVGDLIALLDALSIDKVFLVGHDWGAIVAWHMCLFRPDRVKSIVAINVPFRFVNPAKKPMETMRELYGQDFYICKFQVPGGAEALLSKVGTRGLLMSILSGGKDLSWLSKEDIEYMVSKYEKTGLGGALNYYRNMDKNWELTLPWAGAQIQVPAMFIAGEEDMIYNLSGVKHYVQSGQFKKDVPFLQETVILKSVGHFTNQIKIKEVNEHIHNFIKKFLA